MSRYLQTSTNNPYGRRPWATRLYTGFEDYGFLKQPQNTILREDLSMRPEIYRPPEMKPANGLGDVTIVGGSGRILRRARRRGVAGLGMLMARDGSGPVSAFDFLYRQPRIAAPIAAPNYVPPMAAPISQVRILGPMSPTTSMPPPILPPSLPPITILPPSLMPPVPRPVATGPGGTVYKLPGDATTPGSPFAPPDPGQFAPTGSVPVSSSAAAAAAATPSVSSLSDWFNSESWISGVPNGYVAIGIAGAIFLFSKKKR